MGQHVNQTFSVELKLFRLDAKATSAARSVWGHFEVIACSLQGTGVELLLLLSCHTGDGKELLGVKRGRM